MALANLIDGRAIASQIHSETAGRVAALKARGVQPGLAFVRVGEDPASRVYVGMKEKACAQLGILSQTHVLPQATTEADLLTLLAQLNADPRIHGILVQAPLPKQIREAVVYATVLPRKGRGRLSPGERRQADARRHHRFPALHARWGAGVAGALERTRPKARRTVILGRGNIVGKPMAAILCQKAKHANSTVTICHSQTRDIASHCRRADILIAAMGVAHFVKADMVKPGAVVVDVGVNRVSDPAAKGGTRLVGDVDFEAVRAVAGLITPESRRRRPMTIAMLMQNTARAAGMASGWRGQ